MLEVQPMPMTTDETSNLLDLAEYLAHRFWLAAPSQAGNGKEEGNGY
ncbi:MAG: hypothetical protein J7D61_04240 [Marichromatium sp.]|nr:hypothetical protein [Marichromatium sp.]